MFISDIKCICNVGLEINQYEKFLCIKQKIYSSILNSMVISQFFTRTYECLLDDTSISNLSEQIDLIFFFISINVFNIFSYCLISL